MSFTFYPPNLNQHRKFKLEKSPYHNADALVFEGDNPPPDTNPETVRYYLEEWLPQTSEWKLRSRVTDPLCPGDTYCSPITRRTQEE